MHKAVLPLVLCLTLAACSKKRPEIEVSSAAVPVGSVAERSTLFEGTLPCADCPGIRYQLLLRPDSVFFMRQSYLGREVVDTDDIGRWHLDTERRIVRLRGSREEKPAFRVVSADTLRLLDRSESEISSDLKYALVRREESAPFEPRLAMLGMFTYMADAALFRECASEWRIPVAMEGAYKELEQVYSETVTEPGSPLLAEISGHITSRPAADRDGFEDVVVVDRFEGLWPGETCGAQGATSPLENTFWGLVRMGSHPVRLASDQREVHLRFLPGQSEVRGFAGCNSFSGSFKTDGDLLSFGAIASTRMACPYLDQETALFTALAKVARYHITGDHLELLDLGNRPLLRFEARYFR
jgi:copper homeostasis protein (lipoprotein)